MMFTRTALLTAVLLCSLISCSSFTTTQTEEKISFLEFKDASLETEQAILGLVPGQAITNLPAPTLEVTKEVEQELKTYLARNSASVRLALGRRDTDFKIAKQIFQDEGVPVELLNLAVIESAFQPNATSPAGAVGLWQFTRDTGKRFGLGVCKVKGDQRRDVTLSTFAAARYLKALYGKFDNWFLALAAYNQGEYAVEKAVARYKERSFWKLARSGAFPTETARFVPRFIAVTIIDKLRDRYGEADLRSKLAFHLKGHDQLAKVFSDVRIG